MSDEAVEEEATSDPSTADEAASLVVLTEGAEAADDAETLGSDLGREIVVLDPALLDAEAFARIEEAAAVVVSWDLGTQAGLDVLEALRGDERMEGKPILMSSPEPTQAAVRLAVEAGAAGFLFEPLGSEALLAHLSAEESAGSTPASEAETAEPDES